MIPPTSKCHKRVRRIHFHTECIYQNDAKIIMLRAELRAYFLPLLSQLDRGWVTWVDLDSSRSLAEYFAFFLFRVYSSLSFRNQFSLILLTSICLSQHLFLCSGPRGTMSCRIQGIFCPSVRPSVRTPPPRALRPGPQGQGPRPWTPG